MRGLGLLEVNLHQTCLTVFFYDRMDLDDHPTGSNCSKFGGLNFEPSHVQ